MRVPDASPDTRPTWFRPLSLVIGLVLVACAAVVPLIPEEYRLLNVAAFGAVGLFVTARAGFWPSVALCLGSYLLFAGYNYISHGNDSNYLPLWYVVAAYLAYPLCGLILRRTENPFLIGASALLGGAVFFLVTNFASWVRQDLNYGYTSQGLWTCMVEAIPFHRGTVLGDVLFTGAAFAAHAVLSRAYFPAERVVPRTVMSGDRS